MLKPEIMRLSLLISLVGVLFLASCSKSEDQQRPNVIVILSDDQGWGDLGVHGNSNISTPNIDELSAAGASLENFYVCAVCSPTRAEFLTGCLQYRRWWGTTGYG